MSEFESRSLGLDGRLKNKGSEPTNGPSELDRILQTPSIHGLRIQEEVRRLRRTRKFSINS